MATYAGVKCKTPNCENLIAFSRYNPRIGRTVEFITMRQPVDVRCEVCGQTYSYDSGDLVQFEAKVPADWLL